MNRLRNYLLLDDERSLKQVFDMTKVPVYEEDWDLVRNFEDFKAYINMNELPTLISFDHDLGTEKTGLDCAKFLVEHCMDKGLELPFFLCHSQNPVGKDNILSLLNNFKLYQNG